MGARNGSPNQQDIDDFFDVHHLIDIYKTLSGLFNVSLRKKQPIQVVMYISCFCEAQARVRQGSARDGDQGKRPQSLNPCLELTLKLVATTTHHISASSTISFKIRLLNS